MLQRSFLFLYLFGCCLIIPVYSLVNSSEPEAHSSHRRLIIILDGVPYRTIAQLKSEGRFEKFNAPARMITTFPSLTNAGMIEILQEKNAPGYEDHYFDRESNRLRGGVPDRLRGERFIQGTFRETFDYHAPAVKGALGYLSPPVGALLLAHMDLSELKMAFKKSGSPLFVGYIGETDSLAHLGGERPLMSFLRTLDRTVNELIEESGGKLQVEMFSDHGNSFSEFRSVKLNDAIDRSGFRTEKSLKNSNSVVLPKFGLVGSSVLYTAPENRERLAEVCSAVDGVDFSLYEAGEDTIELISRRGRARILRRTDSYAYVDIQGDPLRLNPFVDSLRATGKIDSDGYAHKEVWWNVTKDHTYADPLRRIFDGFNKYIDNRADVIVSYEDGYLLGSPFLSFFAEMLATHGNLKRDGSEGFVISTSKNLEASIRGNELNKLLSLDRRAKARLYLGHSGHCRVGPALAISIPKGCSEGSQGLSGSENPWIHDE